jgi:hypothetical protein
MDKLLGQMKGELVQSQSQTSFAKDIFSASTTSSRNSKDIDDSTGEGWFNMKSSTMTSQLKRDIQILNLRKALNPTQHYKEAKIGKKHVQYGTVIETHYNRFGTGLGRKPKALVDQLLQDSQFSKQLHSKFLSIQQRRQMGLKPKKIPRKKEKNSM